MTEKEHKKELKVLARKYTSCSKVILKHDGVITMECPVCGRQFSRITAQPWAYKIKSCYFDRYSCMRTAERVIDESMERKRR